MGRMIMSNSYDFRGCMFRFQIPQPGQTPQSARVTADSFFHTGLPQCSPDTVAYTINNFQKSWANEPSVWLVADSWSMAYTGIDKGPFNERSTGAVAQMGLDGDGAVVSILLPSGRAKLELLYAHQLEVPGADWKVISHVVGVKIKDPSKPLVDKDFAYMTSRSLKAVVAD